MEEKRKALYDALAGEYNLGTYEEFTDKINNEDKRRALYDAVKDDYNLGTYEEYSGKLGFPQAARQADNPFPTFDDKPNDPIAPQEPRRGFVAGVQEGGKGLAAGTAYAAGEAVNAITGSSRDDAKALYELNRMVREGRNPEVETAGAWSDFGRELRTGALELLPWWMGKKFKEEIRDKANQQKILKEIGDVLEEAGGDVAKARRILTDRANDPTMGDRWQGWAEEKFSDINPTEGVGAWIGQNAVQMIPSASALIVGALTKSPQAAQVIGRIGMGTMVGATAGSSMYEAREAGADDLKVRKTGVVDGMIEAITEDIPFNRYTKKYLGAAKQTASKQFMDAIGTEGSLGRNQMEKLLVEANERLGGKLFSKKNLKEYMADIAAEGMSEFSAEALQTMTTMIYEKPEDFSIIGEALNNGLQGFMAGVFMGSVLGGASKTMEHYNNRDRRKEQGFVEVGLVDFGEENGGAMPVEVLAEDREAGIASVLKDGEVVEVSTDAIKPEYRYKFSFNEFENARLEQLEDDAIDNETVTEGQAKAAGDRVAVTAAEVERVFAENGYNESSIRSLFLGAKDGEHVVFESEEQTQAYNDYVDALTREKEVKSTLYVQQQKEKAAIRENIEKQVGGRFWQEGTESYDENVGATIATPAMVETGTLQDGTLVYITSPANESGERAGITENGEKKIVKKDMLREGTQIMPLDEYIDARYHESRTAAEQARMAEETEQKINDVRSTVQQGTRINVGTVESPAWGVVNAPPTNDGAVVLMEDGGARLLSWDDIANIQKRNPVLTDAELASRESAEILGAEAALKEEKAQIPQQAEEASEETAVALEEAKIAEPLPMNEDGTVNEESLWNNDPSRWAEWNDEQRQDNGANSAIAVNAAIANLSGQIAEQQNAYAAMPVGSERNAVEADISEKRKRLEQLVSLQQRYAVQEEMVQNVAETQPEAATPMTEEEEMQAEEQRREPLRKRAQELSEKLGVKVNIAEDLADVKESAAREQILRVDLAGGSQRVTGWYNPDTNEVTIYLPHVAGVDEINATYIHEVVSHRGLKELLGEEGFNVLCDSVWDMMSESQKARFMAYPGVDGDHRKAADEFIAHLSETLNLEESRSLWDRIVAAVEKILLSMGVKLKMSHADLSNLLAASYRRLADNAGKAMTEEQAVDQEAEEPAVEEQPEAAVSEVETSASALESRGLGVDTQNDDVRYSIRYTPTDAQREAIIDGIVAVTGRDRATAERWLASETSLAAMVGDNMQYLDYQVDSKYKAIKDNSDYPQGTVDFNNICRKRLPFTKMFTRLQRRYPGRVFTADELADIRNIMSGDGLTVACGLCYVEDRRQMVGEVADQFITELQNGFSNYASGNATKRRNADKFLALVGEDDYIPSIYELTTQEGGDKLYNEHRGVWEAFQAFNNARGQQSQNLLQGYAEYKREILSWSDKKVKSVNDNGGLRIFSYSDFEAHHLLDIIQIIIDCASKGVKIQGYTKVPAFARAVANTGIKLNRSLIPLGDTGIKDGQLAFDPVEGIDINDPDFLESNDNVGNILIGINDVQIRMAMVDPRIHYIIPYHARQKENIRKKLNVGEWVNYISTQNERNLSDGKRVKDNINIYTDVLGEDVTNDRQFVEKYLQLCMEMGRIPKFDQFLNRDAEGNYAYTPGYYKFLVDFKLFDENGDILPQKPVVAEFDDAFNMQILEDYVKGEQEATGDQMNETYDKIVETLGLDESSAEGKDIRFSVKEENPYDLIEAAREAAARQGDVRFRVMSDEDYAMAQRIISNLAGDTYFRRLEGEYELGKLAGNYAELADIIMAIDANRDYTPVGTALLGFFAENPGMHFPLLFNDSKLGKETAKAFTDELSKVDDPFVLYFIKDAWRIHKGSLEQAGLGVKPSSTTKFNKAIDARAEEIRAAEVKGTAFNFKKQESSLDEIDAIFKQLNKDENLALLHDRVMNVARTLGVKVSFAGKRGNTAGESLGDKVSYDYKYFNTPAVADQKKCQTIVHELIHSITTYAIYLEAKAPSMLTDGMLEAVGILRDVYNQIARDPAFKGEYGVTDVYEMVAELSNAQFRDKLKEKNLFQRILDALKRLLGIDTVKEDSAYQVLSDTLDYLIDNYDQAAFDAYALYASKSRSYGRMMKIEEAPRFRITPEQDKAYMDAVEAGDMEIAQRMVVEAARLAMPNTKVVDEDGNPKVVYHGGSSTFTKFNTSLGDGMTDLGQGSYFSSNEEIAHEYTVPNGDNQWQIDNYIEEHPYLREIARTQLGLAEAERIAIREVFKNAKVYPVFLNIENPYYTTMEDFMSGEFAHLYNRDGLKGYDGIIDDTFKDRFEDFAKGSVQYVAFEPSQIKSAEPVTYDNDGNVIPLSERFNEENPDIRFRLTYHGTAAKFKKFDHAHMGEGEGVQAYGWGTYVSEVPGIGETYAKTMREKLVTDTQRENAIVNKLAADILSAANGNRQEALNYLYALLQESWSDKKRVRKEIKIITTGRNLPEGKTKAYLYTVEIPDNGIYIQYEQRMDSQEEIINSVIPALEKDGWQKSNNILEKGDKKMVINPKATGGDFYTELSFGLGSDTNASKFLNSVGITGISYPSQYRTGGREDEKRNFVIFNEEDLEIVESVSFRISNENQAIFVSNAAKAVEGIKQEKATPEQWLKMIEKNGGLKAGEDKWMGLSDWLKASDKKTLTKAEVLDFINENMIIIEEQHYSDEEVAASANKELNDKYPGWDEAFSMDWDSYMDEPYASIWDAETAVELYNNNHEDQIELDEDGEFDNMEDEDKVAAFGKEIAEIFYRGNSDVRPIHGTRSEYQTRGLSSNHEIALTVPDIERWKADDAVHFGDAGDGRAIAWIRFGETWERKPSPQISRKVLVIDEIQSNRHQEGRKRGYKDIRDIRAVKQRKAEIEAEIESLAAAVLEGDRKAKKQQDALFREHRELSMQHVRGEIPDAPFEKNWAELAMKRMLRYAAENGFDVIAWTKGDQQANRYDLSRDVIKISAYRPNAEGERIVTIYYRDEYNDYKTLTVDRDGKVIQGDYNGSALADVIGKEMALQIMNAEDVAEFEGDGLKIGGEGMRGFYDKMLPAFMNKYGKKWGVKVEDIDLPKLGKEGLTMHSVPVTEEMKASVMEGQVMFRVRGEDESATDFHKSVLDHYMTEHKVIVPTTAVDVNDRKAVAEALGYAEEEFSDEMYQQIVDGVNDGGEALYDEDKKRIAIFAVEDALRSADVEENIFHENVHALIAKHPELLDLGQWMWDNANGGALKKCKDEILSQNYEESKQSNEMLSRFAGVILAAGRAGDVVRILPEDQKKHWELLLNELGYEPERNDGDRKLRFKSDTRRAGVLRDKAQQEVSDNGASERTGLSAEERRIVNELFPGTFENPIERAGSEEVRFRATEITPEVQAEMNDIKARAEADGTFMKAPNGADTNLTPEQWALVRTEAFKAWFGDWENDPYNASKVIDINGEPMVVYHGTQSKFTAFDVGYKGKNFGFRLSDGFYFSPDETVAESYASFPDELKTGEVKAVFLNIINPFHIKSAKDYREQIKEIVSLAARGNRYQADLIAGMSESELLSQRGYDGVVEKRTDKVTGEIVVFEPNQIKSATDNTGVFSVYYDIRFRVADSESKREIINNTEPVDVIKGAIAATDGESVSKAALRWFEENVGKELTYNTEVGTVTINRRSVKNSLAHGYSQTKLDAITSLPEGFGRAVYLASEDDFDGKPEVNHYFVYPINYDGSIHYVLCRVKSDVNKSSLYIHEVFPIDAIKGHTLQTAADQSQPHRGISLYLDLLKEVLYGKDTDNLENINDSEENISYRIIGTPTDEMVADGLELTTAQTAELAGNIFSALPEDTRRQITEDLPNILDLQDAIMQIPARLAMKEEWNDEDKAVAEIIARELEKIMDAEMTRPLSISEALWMLYDSMNRETDLISQAQKSIVQRNLGFDSQTQKAIDDAKDEVRFRAVGNASDNAKASLYNKGAVNVWTRLKESFVDMNASVEKFVEAIEKTSGKVAEGFENVLLALNQQSSKGLDAMERYERKFLNPMLDEIRRIMAATDFKYEDIVRHVILKHGLERNEKMAQRDAKAHYQAIYDEIISKIRSMDDRQKRTYLTNAQLKDADAKAALATLQAVDTRPMDTDQLKEHKRKLAKAHAAVKEAAEYLERAKKITSMSEQEALDELDKIFKSIENGTNSVYQELRKNDYSGLTSMFYDQLDVNRKDYETEEEYQSALMLAKNDKYSTLADVEAAAESEVTAFEGLVNTAELWKRINAATKETLKQQYNSNMISKDQYESLRDMFEFYVPLRGFKDNTAEDMYTYYRKPNSTGYTKPILGAEGRKTEAESPFGWIAAMAGSAIASNVKNEAKLALYYFVSNRPDNGIATISKTWFVDSGEVDADGKKIFKPAYPPFSEDLSSDAAKDAFEKWQENMRDLQKKGLAYESGQRLNLGNAVVNISDTNKPEHIVNVKVGGKDYTILINGNPRAAQAINGDLNIESSSQDYGKVFGPMLRWMSSVNTSYNPEFWITNMQRDMLFTAMAVSAKGDAAYRRRFASNYMKAFKVISLVAKNEKGSLGNSYIENMYRDFVENGGVTGYTQIKDNETWEKEIARYMKSQNAEDKKMGNAMKMVKDGLHAFHRFGESLEQVSRFAAFLTSREMGKPMSEAVNDAKEITVNFNRKGSGKMISFEEAKHLTDGNGQPLNKFQQWLAVGVSSIAPLGRRFIMFFNAAIQGLNAMYKLYRINPGKMAGWSIGYFALGVLNALMHSLMDDDDDYLDMPQYERRNSLLLGGNGVYFKWAMPQEARAFYAFGDLAVESFMGRNPHQNILGESLKIGTEILPVNPAEGWKAFLPSVAVPFVELALNEDYKGDPIFSDQKWLSEEEKKRTAKWSKAYQGTGKMYINIAKALNNVTGGDEYDAGLINIQPEKMEHLVQSAFGGTIRTVDKFVNSLMAAIDPEEDVTVRQFPFLNRILTLNDERFKNVHVNDVYDYYAAEADHVASLQKQYLKAGMADEYRQLMDSDEYKWSIIYSRYKKPVKLLQEQIRAAEGTAERKELMKRQDELKRKMIKEISDL